VSLIGSFIAVAVDAIAAFARYAQKKISIKYPPCPARRKSDLSPGAGLRTGLRIGLETFRRDDIHF
jgi:hypothetical protein